ncbi:sigma-70 family RNA polymerase sigma factor [Maritimibacter sp. UBA3975]|uniref:RNA polymerase sigma factor n=1 Tax=Maritimibacter sp. UBA3975 TaxID=1946833 RepID=UPI0025C1C64B|nr:sigma-70 family RNA polymerase sigma factor [Maritimibacter sp. UBA3975]
MEDPLSPLMTAIASGDRAALAGLYQRLEKPVYRFIQSKLNDPHESADILHDVFMDVWRSAGRFEGRSKVQTWVFGIAWRKVIDLRRKSGRMDLPGETPDIADEHVDTEAAVLAGQEAVHVRHCLGELGDEHRMAISLAFYEDMAYGQIAEVAGVPEGTIKTRIYHAKKLLLRCLSGRVTREARA